MSPRRRVRANREKWRADQTGRNIRLKIATHLAAVLVIHGNCAKPETGWSEAERLFTKADSAESAARASAPALLFCEGCPVVRECRRWAAVDRYTGRAAGSAWIRGQEYEPSSPINNPLPRVPAA